jgi:hypothetical protein
VSGVQRRVYLYIGVYSGVHGGVYRQSHFSYKADCSAARGGQGEASLKRVLNEWGRAG